MERSLGSGDNMAAGGSEGFHGRRHIIRQHSSPSRLQEHRQDSQEGADSNRATPERGASGGRARRHGAWRLEGVEEGGLGGTRGAEGGPSWAPRSGHDGSGSAPWSSLRNNCSPSRDADASQQGAECQARHAACKAAISDRGEGSAAATSSPRGTAPAPPHNPASPPVPSQPRPGPSPPVTTTSRRPPPPTAAALASSWKWPPPPASSPLPSPNTSPLLIPAADVAAGRSSVCTLPSGPAFPQSAAVGSQSSGTCDEVSKLDAESTARCSRTSGGGVAGRISGTRCETRKNQDYQSLAASVVTMETPNSNDRHVGGVIRPKTLIALKPTSRVVLKPLSSCSGSGLTGPALHKFCLSNTASVSILRGASAKEHIASLAYCSPSPTLAAKPANKQDAESVSFSSVSSSSGSWRVGGSRGGAVVPVCSNVGGPLSPSADDTRRAGQSMWSLQQQQQQPPPPTTAGITSKSSTLESNCSFDSGLPSCVGLSRVLRSMEGVMVGMGGESPSSSRTSTPTLVRSRPRLPINFFSRPPPDISGPASGGEESSPTAPHQAADKDSLGYTDFVRKYSRKGRWTRKSDGSCSVSSTPARSPFLSPEALSPTPELGSLLEAPRLVEDLGPDGHSITRLRAELERVLHTQDAAGTDRPDGRNKSQHIPNNGTTENSGKHSISTSDNASSGNKTVSFINDATTMSPGSSTPVVSGSRSELRSPEDSRSDSSTPVRKRSTGTPDRRLCHQNAIESQALSFSHPTMEVTHLITREDDHIAISDQAKWLRESRDSAPSDPSRESTIPNENSDNSTQSRLTTGCSNGRPKLSPKSSPILRKPKLLCTSSCERDSDDLTPLHLTEDESSPHGMRRARISTKGSSLETEDEGVGGVDIDSPAYRDTYSEVTRSANLSNKADSMGITTVCRSDVTSVSSSSFGVRDIHSRSRRDMTVESAHGDSIDDGSGRRIPKVGDGTGTTAGKTRFRTHPPIRERDRSLPREGGAVDTNGFSALRDSSEPLQTGELTSQVSVASLDSHICPSEANGGPTYSEVVKDVTTDVPDVDRLERKNSKTLKQKSKSDPSGEKQKETIDIPSVIRETHAQSTPLLTKERVPQLPEFARTTKERKISKSDNILASPENDRRLGRVDEIREIEVRVTTSDDSSEDTYITSRQLKKPSKKRQRSQGDKWEDKKRDDRKSSKKGDRDSGVTSPTTPGFGTRLREVLRRQGSGDPPSPQTQSPDNTLDIRKSPSALHSLTIPLSKANKSGLQRSASSASVYLRNDGLRTPSSGSPSSSSSSASPAGVRPKDLGGRKPRPSLFDHFGSPTSSGPATKGVPGGSVPDVSTATSSPKVKDRGWPSYEPSPIISPGTLSLFEGEDHKKNKRDLIVQEFYSTEKQYVEALQTMVEKYMIPMKSQGVLDSNLVDDIFYKVNEIYMHHATFLTFLGKVLQDWRSATSTIGDIIHRTFSKQTVIESYMSFIENFPRAEKVLDVISSKSSFQKFIEGIEREARIKLPLKAQIVKPAQRIPRYELLLKRLLDNTPHELPDYKLLTYAEKAIHDLALKINSVKESKQGEDLQETLKKLELLLITDLAIPERLYIRHDMVQVLNRKDQCCVWLFSDLAVLSAIKRKSGPVNRRTTLLLQSPTGNDFVENTKHKMWLKISLEDLEIIHNENQTTRKQLIDKDLLEDDFRLLSQITDATNRLSCPHQILDENVRELLSHVNRQLSEHQLKSPPPEANKVELVATTTVGLEQLVLVFPTPEKRVSWEATFIEAKQKLADLTDSKPPDFSQALPITKTRAGMQFSCASPIEGLNGKQYRDVWVCNSDGYVGHMCLLSLQPEPIVTLNTPVPGCGARILCICAVPPFVGCRRKGSGRRSGVHLEAPEIRIQESEDLDTPTPAGDPGYLSDSSSDDSDDDRSGLALHIRPGHTSRSSSPDRSGSGSEAKSPRESACMDPSKSTMWLGTEDGCILIFPSTENLKTTKNKIKLQQNAAVICIIHMEETVFVSLANGDLVIYKTNKDGLWDTGSPAVVNISSASAPVLKMLAVAGRVWCACLHNIIVLNPATAEIEATFRGNPDNKKSVQCLAVSGLCVCVAAHGSAKVVLFHAVTHERLGEVSVAQAVAVKLQSADEIIRQHKTACLRVTSLLACKDLLWVGTSAGVILTLPLPKVLPGTTRANTVVPNVTGLVHGHTGHVRFLTAVELLPQPRSPHLSLRGDCSNSSSDSTPPSWRSRRMSVGVHAVTLATKMLVISGGDGYEDFRGNGQNEAAGKDDSTNHLLLWQV